MICDGCRFFDPKETIRKGPIAPADYPLVYRTCKRFPQWVERRPGDTCGEHRPVEQ